MLRKAVITVVLAAAVATPAAAAPVRGQTLLPGVIYARQVDFTGHGPVILNVVSAPRPTGLYSIRAALSNGLVPGRARLTDMENDASPTATVLGINGDLFDSRWGSPSSLLIRGGALVTGTRGGRSAAGFDSGGSLRVDRMSLAASWKGSGQFRPMGLNDPPGRSTTTLYTSAWGPTTPAEVGTVAELTVEPFPAAKANVTLTAPATQLAQSGSQPIPPDGAVLVARSDQAAVLTSEAGVGKTISVRLVLTPRWDDVVESVGGGPVLVRNGRPVFRANEAFTPSQLVQRTARSAVGQTSDGRLVFVTADGGRPGYSLGVTNFDLALALMRLGAANAVALGTGSSAELAFDGKLLSRPSGKFETPLADALLYAYEGVYIPAPAGPIPSGKPVTLTYKVVRRSTVTATLTDANGVTTTLDAGDRAPGTYRFDSTPADGRWTFSVNAVDDLGRRSSADRTFTVGQSAKRR